ncbi:hypothetical protein VIGAN_03165100 [Vigna angularis var. angularis]|uniref:Uncharacterized protein n=1 Tax=Vigna angularis var. angularis TaxID=157739 RepID=A0A0S3RMG4_PHAAN|nr:hypothetical protein VIGAN_03165100 [Vigna angularis var. angularis]
MRAFGHEKRSSQWLAFGLGARSAYMKVVRFSPMRTGAHFPYLPSVRIVVGAVFFFKCSLLVIVGVSSLFWFEFKRSVCTEFSVSVRFCGLESVRVLGRVM